MRALNFYHNILLEHVVVALLQTFHKMILFRL